MRKHPRTRKPFGGFFQPGTFWLSILGALLLTTASSGGQDSQIRLPRKFKVKSLGTNPDTRQTLSHDDASLEITNAALPADVDLEVQPLAREQLAVLDSGMTNATLGPRSGYRMLPHGMKFKKEIRITLPFDKSRLAPGSGPEDVQAFFYDENAKHWVTLPRLSVDPVAGKISFLTDHFTDFVAATITVPDQPGLASFNPTEIRDLAAANPAASIHLIEPPKATFNGVAATSYPLEVPPGRLGLQPSLSTSYSSTGKDSWMGLGWDLAYPCVTVETRWGVPRYDPVNETESYLLSGEQLTPLAHREAAVPRQAEKTFSRRVEGSFERIVRHGDHPTRYWWEVTDKNGTKRFYGGDPATGPAADCTLASPLGVFHWALREVRDTHGNFIRYRYATVADAGMAGSIVLGTELYLQSISYTGSGAQEGPYSVTFLRDRDLGEPRRPDVQIDCRGGFKRVTADLLRRVDVRLNASLIRRYEFRYREGAFRKSLLDAVLQYGEDGTTEFHRHTFDYFDDVRTAGGAYQGLAPSVDWNSGNDHVTAGLLGSGQASALGGSSATRLGGHLYVGWSFDGPSKEGSFGFKVGYNQSTGNGVLSLSDVDGDGLPDKVFRTDQGSFYRLNQSGPAGMTSFGPALSLPTLPAISRETSSTVSFGVEAYPFINVFTNFANTFTHGSAYLTDVNGDGFTDLVKDGQVRFGYLDPLGNPSFSPDSSLSPVPVGAGAVDATELLEDYEALYQQNIDLYPLQDTLRRWVAPYAGTVQITGPVTLLPDLSLARQQYATADGVRVAIQHNGAELWSSTIAATDYASQTPGGVGGIPVQPGDRLYFRVQSVFDGSYDQVSWDPEITYVGAPAAADVNGLNPYRAKASEDFTFAGRPGIFVKVPLNGTVRLTGDLLKKAATTDDVTLLVTKNGAPVFSQTLPASQAGTIAVTQDIPVARQDVLQLRVKADSPIDLSQIQWAPNLFYINSPDVATVTDDQGAFILQLNPPYDIDFYPVDDLTAPQQAWTVTQTGTLTIVPELTAQAGTDGTVVFTVKKQGQLLLKQPLTILNGVVQTPPITLAVTQNDVLYFDYSAYDPALKTKTAHKTVSAYYGNPNLSFSVPAAFHSEATPGLFPGAYRGWDVVGYNGNRDRAALPVNESLLVLTTPYDVQTARAYPFNPFPSTGRWKGPDDQGWISACQASSTRLGLKYIQVPRPSDFAGARGVTRLSRAQQTTVGAGAFLFSGSSTVPGTGSCQGLVDFIDMNGDRFPDIISNGRIQYSTPSGGLEVANRTVPGFGNGKVRKSTDLQANVGVGASPAMFAESSKGNNGHGKGTDTGSQLPPLGLSGSLGTGDSQTTQELMDVNGDGLPDRVFMDGNQAMVALNLGYGFADPEPWPDNAIYEGNNTNGSVGASIGFNDGIYGWGGGLSLSKSQSDSKHLWADVNGDGLVDRLRLAGSDLFVGFNTGNGFAPEVLWSGGVNRGLSRNGNTTLGGGFYFTIGIPVYLVGYIIINPGFDADASMSRPETFIRDVDGDGLADYLVSTSDGTLTVSRNMTGKTNLLRGIHRPLGAAISMDYSRNGNTRQDPGSHWVLSRTEVHDGHPGDGVDLQVMTYRYESGHQDRLEREFLGFARVTEEVRDVAHGEAVYRSVVYDYLNDNIYTKGLLSRQRKLDGAGHVFLESEFSYVLRDVASGNSPASPASLTNSLFPMLVRTDQRYFEGQAVAQKSTTTTNEFDAFGNLTRYTDSGDLAPQDDLEARVTYSAFAGPHIVGKPTSIQVFGNGVLGRRREATIDPVTGDLTQVRQYLANGTFAPTDLAYFANGNLRSITRPSNLRGQRYALNYAYDPVVATHVTLISDSFGYSSSVDYTFKYARPTSTTDVSLNVSQRAYDLFGRLVSATGPYDIGGVTATIRFEYHHDAAVPRAHSFHLDTFRNAADPIETVVFTDGLARVLQTKKDAALHVGPAAASSNVMLVSGSIIFDFLGRPVEQRYPTTEAPGIADVFNAVADPVAPTRTTWDVLDRATQVTRPDGVSTLMSYGFEQDRTGVLQFSTTSVDGNGNQTTSYHDVRGLSTSLRQFNVQKGQTVWTSYATDAFRQLVEVLDDRSNSTRSEYDLFGRRTAIDSPDKGRTEETYDLADNVITRVSSVLRAQNKAIAYDYEYNRLTKTTYPNSPQNNATYTYGAPGAPFNRAGRIQSITDAGGTLDRFYGKLGEIVKETRFIPIEVPGNNNADRTFTTQYVYDSFNRLQQMTYPDGEVLTYSYDSGGMLASVRGVLGAQNRTYVTRLEYDKFASKAFLALGNGITTSYAYDPLNRRLSTLASAQPAQAPFQSLQFSYDSVGNILQLSNAVAVPNNAMGGPTQQTFQYDSLYRLTHAEGSFSGNLQGLNSSTYTLDMDYDTLHNIQQKNQKVQVNGKQDKAMSYVLNYRYQGPQPHAPTTIGSRDFTYDADGNQISYDGKDDFGSNGKVTRSLVWDEEDRLSSVSDQGGGGKGNTTSFVYDHAGRRVIKRSTGHELAYVSPTLTVRNRDHQMLMTKHVLAGSLRIAATALGGTLTAPHPEVSFFYYHSDHLGSAQYLSDGAAQLRQHNEYIPFGETWITQVRDNADQVKENPYLFAGKEFDSETSLYSIGARYYDPRTSVWQNPDQLLSSLREDGFRRMAVGPYAYAYQRPTMLTDPTGMEPEEAEQDPPQEFRFDSSDKKNELPSTMDLYREFGPPGGGRQRSPEADLLLNALGSVLNKLSKMDNSADGEKLFGALKGTGGELGSYYGKALANELFGLGLDNKPLTYSSYFDTPGPSVGIPLGELSDKTRIKFHYDIPLSGGTAMKAYHYLADHEDFEPLKFGIGITITHGKNFSVNAGGHMSLNVDPPGHRVRDYIGDYDVGVSLDWRLKH